MKTGGKGIVGACPDGVPDGKFLFDRELRYAQSSPDLINFEGKGQQGKTIENASWVGVSNVSHERNAQTQKRDVKDAIEIVREKHGDHFVYLVKLFDGSGKLLEQVRAALKVSDDTRCFTSINEKLDTRLRSLDGLRIPPLPPPPPDPPRAPKRRPPIIGW